MSFQPRTRVTSQPIQLARPARRLAYRPFRDQVAARRHHNVGVVSAARRQLEYVIYALRDHHLRALATTVDHHRSQHARPAA